MGTKIPEDSDSGIPQKLYFESLQAPKDILLSSNDLILMIARKILELFRKNPSISEDEVGKIITENNFSQGPKNENRIKTYHGHLVKGKLCARKYQRLLDFAPDAFFQGNKKGDFTMVNSKAAELTGYSKEELFSMSMENLFSLSNLTQTPPRYDLLNNDGETVLTEREIIRKDGTSLSVEMSSMRMSDGTYQLFMRDITSRKQIENKTERLIRTLKMMSECNLMLVQTENEQELLDAVCSILIEQGGYRMCWIGYIQQNEEKLVSPMARSGFEDEYLSNIKVTWNENDIFGQGPTGIAIQKGIPVVANDIATDVTFFPWRDEAIRRGYVSSIALPLVIEGKEIIGALMIYAEETEAFINEEVRLLQELALNISHGIGYIRSQEGKKKSEELLLQSEKQFREVLENSSDVSYKRNLQTNTFDYLSPRFFNISGYTREEMNHFSFETRKSLIHPEDREDYDKKINFALSSSDINSISQIVYRFKHKDGGYRWFQNRFTVTHNPDGSPIALIGSICDVTRQKETEENLRSSEEQLQIRQKMDSLGTLAGGIGHDFKNLLTGIVGYSEMLRDSLEGSMSLDQKRYIENVLRSCNRAAHLTTQLQSLSRNAISEMTTIDIFHVAADVFQFLDATIDKLIHKSIDIKEKEFYVIGSDSELHHVLLNLGTNSFEAIKDKGIQEGDFIKIHAEDYLCNIQDITGLPAGEYVHLTFEDNGKGMSDELQKIALNPYVTTKVKGEKRGQGLGLAMAYNIISKMKGHISIESVEGKGTIMHIYLPKALPPQDPVLYNETIIEKKGIETVLIIEDEEDIRLLSKEILESEGYRVLTAFDGVDGLEAYKANLNVIDVVILDLTMPRMSGQAVLDEILKIRSDIRVIISSGQSSENINPAILSKAKKNIQKPFRIHDFLDIVRNVLDIGKENDS